MPAKSHRMSSKPLASNESAFLDAFNDRDSIYSNFAGNSFNRIFAERPPVGYFERLFERQMHIFEEGAFFEANIKWMINMRSSTTPPYFATLMSN